MRCPFTCCLLFATTVALPSQTTHLVGPGGFATFAAALAAAAPGDVLLVQPGSYAEAIDADIGVTIRALGTVQVQHMTPPSWNVPPGQNLHVDGVTFTGSVDVRSGRVTLSHCTILPAFGGTNPALSAKDCSVHLVGCALTSLFGSTAFGQVGTQAENTHLTAVDTSFTAAGAFFAPVAVRLIGSQFVASGCSFPVDAFSGGLGIFATAGSAVWLSDSTIEAGPSQCPIVAIGSTVRYERCTLSPTTATNCATSAPGPTLLGVHAPSPLQSGATYSLQFQGAPFQFVALHASPGVATTALPALFEQPLQLDLATAWFVGLYATDATGAAGASWNLPAGQFVDTPLWLQAITVEPTFPWQVAPVVGGIVR
ncbi:MAG: hypothetical protein JNL08_09525 [Planctomycetes bacterium]|nr:hypothetical protein [Planctomycetota bacterium]